MCFTILILLCAVTTHAWQGRMAGMGGVYGLVEDESDFLTHPAGIANGKGLNFYGNLQIGSQTTDKNDYSILVGPANDWWGREVQGHGREFQYGGLAGFAFPVGPGRMGVFLQYTGVDGNLKGDKIETEIGTNPYATSFESNNRLDNLALRLLYGIPLYQNMKLGAEFQIGYKKEKLSHQEIYSYLDVTNEWFGGRLYYLGVPYKSEYYEASMKASMETMIGPAKTSFTLRGGLPFHSGNRYETIRYSGSTLVGLGDMNGKVKGYNLGTDAWIRLPLNGSLTLPFLMSVDYGVLKRDGSPGFWWNNGYWWDPSYKQKQTSMTITAGGGIDATPVQGTRIAAGLYYSYHKSKNSFDWIDHDHSDYDTWYRRDWSSIPKITEHTIFFKGSVEKALSSDVSLTGGFNVFYRLVKQKNDFTETTYSGASDGWSLSAKGKQWGAGASLGAVVKAGATMVEPYIAIGFKRLKLSGDGAYYEDGDLDDLITDARWKKNTWSIGGGLAIRF